MAEILGFAPEAATLVLTEGTDYLLDLTLKDGAWPAGTTATIKLLTASPITWAATLTGATLRWRTEQTGTTAVLVPNGTRFRLVISLPGTGGGPTTEFARYVGRVVRKD